MKKRNAILLIGAAMACGAVAREVSETLPVLHIETEGRQAVTSKTVYLDGKYWIDASGCEDAEGIGSEAESLPLQIRGRGHSSWKGDKKPYKLKLGKKTEVLGMPKNKHWALLKPTENTIAGLELARLLDMAWTPSLRPVEVVLNGDYIGLYFLTETIRIDENRVNIFEQKDQETDPDLITGGWLVEVDNYKDECQITIPECSAWNLTLRYHSPEVLSPLQSEWLTEEFKSINAAIYSDDKTSEAWEQYIDVESMARFFILQEVMDNPDGFHGSFYLHKDLGPDAKWTAGPAWDMSCYFREKTDYTFRMKVHYTFTPHWIGEMIQYDSFCQSVRKVWEELYPSRLGEIFTYVDDEILPLDAAWRRDCERWGGNESETVEVRAERIKDALEKNMEWMDAHLPGSPYTEIPDLDKEDGVVKVYSLQGVYLGEYEDYRFAVSSLTKGIYIINGRKVAIP